MKYRGVFFGSPPLGAATLKAALALEDIQIVAAVTKPDAASGPLSPEKELALAHNIPVLQPDKLDSHFLSTIRDYEPDFILLAAYGKILPQELLDIPKIAPLNIHPSNLPLLRGPSPILYAILEGFETTRVSLMIMVDEVDAGDLVAQSSEVEIEPTDTTGSLNEKILPKIEEVMQSSFMPFLHNGLSPIPQEHALATFTKLIKKQRAKLKWDKEALRLEREVRAYQPWPISFFEFEGNRIQVIEAGVTTGFSIQPGEVQKTALGFAVQTADHALEILKVKPAGKGTMSAKDFLNGKPQIVGSILE
jgi:methionyl-tRNA formyltransferase